MPHPSLHPTGGRTSRASPCSTPPSPARWTARSPRPWISCCGSCTRSRCVCSPLRRPYAFAWWDKGGQQAHRQLLPAHKPPV